MRPEGSGFASTVRLYREGWRVVAAMRTPDRGMPLLREATGATEDDDRLIGVQLDLMDSASISAAAKTIEEAIGAPYALVNNAGISAAGMVEEADMELWQNMLATHVLGPVALTKALLAVDAGGGPGPHRVGLERRRGARSARHRAVFGGQRRAGAVG